ncbi:MAG: OmpA family protein [Terriglobia bacterium]
MKRLREALIVSLLVLGVSLAGLAQEYEPPTQANSKDIYCSGFVASTPLPSNLRIVMAEDALGRIVYSQYDYVYLGQGGNGGVQEGQRYLVVRPVNDPDPIDAFGPFRKQTSILKRIGRLYQDIGRVQVTAVGQTTATAVVQEACDALNAGDVVIPFEERPAPEYKPAETFDRFAPPSGLAEGTVILGKDFQHMMGQGDPIYVNLGTAQGAKVGDYYRLYRYGSGTIYEGYKGMGGGTLRSQRGIPRGYEIPRMRRDLPREVLGEAQVVRSDQNSSTAIVTLSLREIHAGDFVELQPPAAPQASLAVEPASIPRGASATLSWVARAADQAEVTPGIGAVERRGSKYVSPTGTTTYTLAAQGPGGTAEATATLTVVQPPPAAAAPPPAPAAQPSPADLFAQSAQDVFFDFNSAELMPQATAALQRLAGFLQANPGARVLIEGHCDEIGTEGYNRALGQRRAEAARSRLVSLGVNPNQLQTAGIGKSRRFCDTSSDEACRQLNRRAHFVLQP